MPTRAHACLAAIAALLATGATAAPAAGSPGLNGTAWVLSALPGHPLVKNTTVTLEFADAIVSGSDGCNNYSGRYTESPPALHVDSRLAATLRACPADIMAQAQAFIATLTSAHSYRRSGNQLELLSADGTVRATLAAQSRSLADTSWNVVAFNNGRQAVGSLRRDTKLTLVLSADGHASGSAGCNSYTAPYKSGAGGTVTFGKAAVTRRMCAQPSGVMEQEQQFLKALDSVATARIDGDRLELRTAQHSLAIILKRATGK